jgi:hypothetical protein
VAAELLAIALSGGPAHLWVFEGNRRAQRFYAKHGFGPGRVRRSIPTPAGWKSAGFGADRERVAASSARP